MTAFSERLRLAREARGLFQSELSDLSGIPQSTISKYETGLMTPSEPHVKAFARVLEYPVDFFFAESDPYGFFTTCAFPRKRRSLGSRDMRRLQAQMNVYAEHAAILLSGVDLETEIVFPRIDIEKTTARPEEIAEEVRGKWGLPFGPIRNLVKAVERAGGIVFRFDFGTRKLDGISMWPAEMPPIFFLNSRMPPDRSRFSLAHEIGHMVMHRATSVKQEEEANDFGRAFLMPDADAIESFKGHISLPRLMELKAQWRVSMGFLIERAYSIDAISKSQRSLLWMQMSKSGWRLREPVQVPEEIPATIPKLIKVYMDDLRYTVEEMARLLRLSEREFRVEYLGETLPPAPRMRMVK